MQVKVIGKKTGSFTDKTTGQVIDYGQLHCVAPWETNTGENAPKTDGEQCMIVKLKPELMKEVKVGSEVTLVFNQYGKVESVICLDEMPDKVKHTA